MWVANVPYPVGLTPYQIHQYLWGYFSPDQSRPFLYRVHNGRVIMLCRLPPSTTHRRLSILAGQAYQFWITGNAVIKRSRTGIRHHLRTPDLQREWLMSRVRGAEIRYCRIVKTRKEYIKYTHIEKTEFHGMIYVKDKSEFDRQLQNGIGPAKAFGCGLMYLPEVMG